MDILNDVGYEKMTFENYDFTDFWDDIDYSLNEYVEEYPSDEMIESVEKELGYKLPESYIWLMKQHNGGITTKSCFPTNEPTTWAEDHVAITGISGIGRKKRYSLCGQFGSQFMIDEWEYPAIGVAICDCPSAGHDMIFLDYRECGPKGEPKVVHVEQEHDYKITHLADTFEEFICGLKDEEFFEDDFDDLEDDNVEILELANTTLKISDILKSDFNWDEVKIEEDEFDKLSTDLIIDFLSKNTPQERQLLAISWNFDNPKKVIQWIVNQPDTDRGTILYLYWHMSPTFCKNFSNRKECEENESWYLEDYDIINNIEKNWIADFYKNQVYAFNPSNDVYCGGYDWTSEYDKNKVKVKIPDEMFEILDGETLEKPEWEEGIPSDILDIMDKLCDALDD